MISHPSFPVNQIHFCPVCGQSTSSSIDGKAIECNSCGFVLYFNSSTAVAAIITNSFGEVLFTVRNNDPARGMLDLPGGFVDPGETAEQALLREIREELNLTITQFEYMRSFANTYLYKNVLYHTTDLVFICLVESLEQCKAGDDVLSFVFRNAALVEPDEIGLASIRAAVVAFVQKI